MRRLYWSLLLPFFLLLAQQGEIRHQLSQHGPAQVDSQKKAPNPDRCDACLAYAQLAGPAGADAQPTALLASLSYHHAVTPQPRSVDAELPPARSRGPPVL